MSLPSPGMSKRHTRGRVKITARLSLLGHFFGWSSIPKENDRLLITTRSTIHTTIQRTNQVRWYMKPKQSAGNLVDASQMIWVFRLGDKAGWDFRANQKIQSCKTKASEAFCKIALVIVRWSASKLNKELLVLASWTTLQVQSDYNVMDTRKAKMKHLVTKYYPVILSHRNLVNYHGHH